MATSAVDQVVDPPNALIRGSRDRAVVASGPT